MEHMKWDEIETYINNKDADWKKREEAMKSIVIRISKKDKHVLDFINKHAKGIALQLNDLRSVLVKLAATIIEKASFISETIGGSGLEKFSDILFKDVNMIKALGSANKVINIHAASAFRALFNHNQVGLNVLENFFQAYKDNKNINIRERVAEGLFLYINTLKTGKAKAMRADGELFLRKAIEVCLKDASGNVRTFAKNAKAELDGASQMSHTGITVQKDIKGGFKSVKTNTMPIESYKQNSSNNSSFEVKKTVPVPKKDKPNGFKIENDDTGTTKTTKFNSSKNEQKRLIKAKMTSIIDLLEDSRKQVKERLEELSKYDLEYGKHDCTGNEFKKILKQSNSTKNQEIKRVYQNFIEEINISKFIGSVLSYIETEKLDQNENSAFIIDRILKEDISSFIEYFLLRNNSFSLRILLDRFDIDEFEQYIIEKPDTVPSLLSTININMVEYEAETYLNQNAMLLEHIYQSSLVISQYKNYEFSEAFLEKLKLFNSGIYKFLANRKKKTNIKNVVDKKTRSQEETHLPKFGEKHAKEKKMEIEEHNKDFKGFNQHKFKQNVSAKSDKNRENLNDLIIQLQTSISTLSFPQIVTSIEATFKYLKNNDILANEPDVYVTLEKTRAILLEFLLSKEIDEEIISPVYRLIEELFNIYSIANFKIEGVLNTVLQLIVSQAQHKDRLAQRIVNSSIRSDFYNYLLFILDDKNSKIVVDGLKILAVLIKYGKKSQNYLTFHKEVANNTQEISTIMKSLFSHQEVSVRKNVVHFLVECYFFMDHTLYTQLYDTFTSEQQKLIEIYIKKAREV